MSKKWKEVGNSSLQNTISKKSMSTWTLKNSRMPFIKQDKSEKMKMKEAKENE